MSKAVVVQYQTRATAAAENQQLIEKVIAELHETQPSGVSYASFRLADGVSFIHVGVFDDGTDALAELPAFARFQEGIAERTAAQPIRTDAALIGSYGFTGNSDVSEAD